MKQRVTIDDVAKAAGVSKQTVSRAINNKGEIHPETKQRIMGLVKSMGYRPSRLAQAMNTQRSQMIGLIVPDITNPFFPEVARGVQDAALAHDYSALIVNTDEKPTLEMKVLDMLVDQGVDGFITFTHRISDAEFTAFSNNYRPMVLINRLFKHPNVNMLLVDNRAGAVMAVDYLASLGHTKIGMLVNSQFEQSQIRRLAGYKAGLEKNGFTVREELIMPALPFLEGGYEATVRLLQDHPEVTALFCYNDIMGLGAIRACIDLGLRVPEDVSVVGFDNVQLAAMNSPSLTTISVDKYEMGRIAFNRILDLIENPDRPVETIKMDVELIIRESTGPRIQS